MNHLKNGTTAVGAPGSIAREFAEKEDLIRGLYNEAKATWKAANPNEISYERYWYGRMVSLDDALNLLR